MPFLLATPLPFSIFFSFLGLCHDESYVQQHGGYLGFLISLYVGVLVGQARSNKARQGKKRQQSQSVSQAETEADTPSFQFQFQFQFEQPQQVPPPFQKLGSLL